MATKNILGLDLGVGSIGWALIQTEDNQPKQILGMGSRIVPLTKDDSDQFTKGQAISKNADRTARRTARKGYDRYQMRRAKLTLFLREHAMLPERMDEYVIDLWKLRADAATPGCQLTLQQIGRVLYHLNQKRGYKHSKADESGDAKQTKYVAAVNQRYAELRERKQTIGQYFYEMLKASEVQAPNGGSYYTFRTKEQVFPRNAYIEEFDRIMAVQKGYYPEVLTDENIDYLRNHIIFYQRPLKSCKHLVSLCEFELRPYKNKQGKVVYSGPKCAPRTSPLAALCAIWETVNNISLSNRKNEHYVPTLAERQKIVEHLGTHEKLTATDLQKILGFTKADGWYAGKAVGKGIKGNATMLQLRAALDGQHDDLLRFELPMEDAGLVDITTGEVIMMVSPKVEEQPLFRLWHVVYSVSDHDELKKALEKQFGITDEAIVDRLFHIDFVKPGYANKSHKFIRKLLPYLMQGKMYSDACGQIGVNHSGYMTKQENAERPLLECLPLLQKNELRQPIVEKILNQMINIVNALHDEYGTIDEIRVELARELKQSRDERDEAYKAINKNERENAAYAELIKEMGVRPTRSRIQKYKMWLESEHCCFYCGKPLTAKEFLSGADAEVEHIIPKSILFDDSFSNKVCSCRACNAKKGNLTAIEFIESQGQGEVEAYVKRVDEAFKAHRISKTKRDHLLWHTADIPQDFIERQLRQSQYIARKAVELLQQGCRNVYATSGSVTDFLRHQWGYDEVLHTLNFPRYAKVAYTEMVPRNGGGEVERIKGWSKRIDHRHHAVDALTIALTRQAYIQRLNTLNTERDAMYGEVQESGAVFNEKRSLLEKWVSIQPHFAVSEVQEKVDGILVSFRAGKKVSTPAKRAIYRGGKKIIVQDGLLVPRGPLSEETVYGKVNGQYVVKYPLENITLKDIDSIVNPTIAAIVKARLEAFGGKAKDAFARPLYSDAAQTMEIRSVRCYTGLQDKSVAPVRFTADGTPIGYSKPGNNHHIAIYQDAAGKYHELVVSFLQAVERKRLGLPVVVADPAALWTSLMDKDLPETVLQSLPADGWQFVTSLQVNEMFILGMDEAEYEAAIEAKDYQALNKYLYRVQKLATKNYCFRYHTETSVDDKYDGTKNEMLSKQIGKVVIIQSLDAFWNQSPHKVKVNILGEISAI